MNNIDASDDCDLDTELELFQYCLKLKSKLPELVSRYMPWINCCPNE